MKKLLAILLAAVMMCTLLAGCDNTDDNSSVQSAEDTNNIGFVGNTFHAELKGIKWFYSDDNYEPPTFIIRDAESLRKIYDILEFSSDWGGAFVNYIEPLMSGTFFDDNALILACAAFSSSSGKYNVTDVEVEDGVIHMNIEVARGPGGGIDKVVAAAEVKKSDIADCTQAKAALTDLYTFDYERSDDERQRKVTVLDSTDKSPIFGALVDYRRTDENGAHMSEWRSDGENVTVSAYGYVPQILTVGEADEYTVELEPVEYERIVTVTVLDKTTNEPVADAVLTGDGWLAALGDPSDENGRIDVRIMAEDSGSMNAVLDHKDYNSFAEFAIVDGIDEYTVFLDDFKSELKTD